MFEIGASLREARTKRGLSPDDVQRAIRIRERYLFALEEEDWALLPGDTYAKGFLRSYAEYLGLDGNLYVDEFNSRFAHREEEPFVPEPVVVQARRSVGLLRPLVAIGAIVAVVAAVAAWQLHGSPRTPGAKVSAGAHGGAPATPTGAATRPSSRMHTTAPKTPPRTVVHASRAALTASGGRVWLLVRAGSDTGPVVYQGVLEQGQTLPLKLSPRVWMRVGAPWYLTVTVAGKQVSGLPAQVGNVFLSARGLTPAR